MALDLGVRSFFTGFDGTGWVDIAKGDFGGIARLCHHLDDLPSRLSKVPGLKRRRMRQAAFRLRENIRDLVDECHRRVAAFLTDNYRWIFLPTFESARMVARAGRKFGGRTARAMLTWAHCRFKPFLKFQAKKNTVLVVEVSEAYTSQTCTKCGHIHTRSGGAKVFGCPRCNQYAATRLARRSGCCAQSFAGYRHSVQNGMPPFCLEMDRMLSLHRSVQRKCIRNQQV